MKQLTRFGAFLGHSAALSTAARRVADTDPYTAVIACQAQKQREESEKLEFGTICNCLATDDGGVQLLCQDGTCRECSSDLTVCAEFSFGHYFLMDGQIRSAFSMVEYIRGRSDVIEYNEEQGGCQISVNGNACNACYPVTCDDGFETITVQCSNVVDGADFSLCNMSFNTSGVFQFFNPGDFNTCFDDVPGELSCLPLFSNCSSHTECCSGRCAFSVCKSLNRGESKFSQRLSGARGGAGGQQNGRLRG